MTELSGLPVGTVVRLYRRYPDGTRRAPALFKPRGSKKYINLAETDLRIVKATPRYVLVETDTGVQVPMAAELRIKEAAYVRERSRRRRKATG